MNNNKYLLLPDKEMDAVGNFKNVKARKKMGPPPLISSILRTFATKTPSFEALKGY